MTSQWYVVSTKHNLESFAAEQLSAQGFQVYNPRFRVTEIKRNKPCTKIFSVYPSYIFVRFNERVDPWRSIYGTRGVVTLVGAGPRYIPSLPVGFVEDLIVNEDEYGFLKINEVVKTMAVYAPGDIVTVAEGPLKGLDGICKYSNKGRIRVFMTLLGRQTEVVLPISSVAQPALSP